MTNEALARSGGLSAARALLVLALAWIALVPVALAQPRMPSEPQLPRLSSGVWFGDPDRDAMMVNAHIGFGGVAVADRWTPLRLTMASTSMEGYEGIARVRVVVNSEVSVHEAPFALPPATGRERFRETTTAFIGFVSAGPFPERYSIEFEIIGRPLGTNARPGVLQRGVFESPANPRSIGPPMGIDRGDPLVLVIGQSSAHASMISTHDRGPQRLHFGGMRGRNMVHTVGAEVNDLPFPASRWMLYDGFDAVVLSRDALAGLGESRKQALRGWVEFGGHLVIVSDLLGLDADELLPRGLLSAAIVADTDRGDGTGRVSITPTRTGAAMGWSPVDLPGVRTDTGTSGPVGLGWMTVLSRDPGEGLEVDDINAIWSAVLRIDTLLALRRSMDSSGNPYSHYYGISGDAGALRGTLDHAAYTLGVKPMSGAVIGLLVLGIGLLIAVGTTFGDWFLLGSARRRRLSFMTATAWLLGGSVVALVVPMLLRAGETSAVRVQVIDINEANGAMASGEVFAISAGRRLRFVPPGQGSESWGRRVSAMERRGMAMAGAASEQFAGNSLGSGVASLWTFHAAVNEGVGAVPGLERGALDVGAALEMDQETGEPMLDLRRGLGRLALDHVFVSFKRAEPMEGSDVDSGLVSLRVPVPRDSAGVEPGRIVLRSGARSTEWRDGFWPRGHASRQTSRSWRRAGHDPGLLSGLPGVALRNAAVHAALGTGRYAAVTMWFDAAGDAIAAKDDAAFAGATEPAGLIERGVTHRWVRVLVPIDEMMRDALVDLYDGGIDRPAAEGVVP